MSKEKSFFDSDLSKYPCSVNIEPDSILRSMEEIARMGNYIYDLSTSRFQFSDGLYKLFGEEPGAFEPTMESVNARSLPEDGELVRRTLEQAALDKMPYYYTRTVRRTDGEWRLLSSHGRVICDENGKAIHLFGVVQDITEQSREQKRLRENQELLQSIFDSTLIGMSLLQAIRNDKNEITDFKILFINKVLQDLTQREDLVGKSYANEYPGVIESGLFGLMLKVMETGEPAHLEYRYEHDGFDRWFSSTFIKFDDGLVSTNLDITERKQAEEEEQKSYMLLKQTEQIARSGSWNYDVETGDLAWSEGMYNLFHLEPGTKVTPETYLDFIVPDEREKLESIIRKIKSELQDFEEELNFIIEGERRLMQIKATPLLDTAGRTIQMIGIDIDITAKRSAEEKQRENEFMKMLLEKKDEFMSVASHELKTPITTTKASLQILCRLIENRAEEQVQLLFAKKANLQINKVIRLIGDLMDNAKIQAGKINLNFDFFSLGEVIEECVAFQTSPHKITIRNEVKERIEGDRNRIEQVLINFLSNAIKYSPAGEEIIISASQNENRAKVETTDFGVGIPPEKIDRVFDRFFRVDDKSQQFSGLGLGLYISSEIIKRHGGEYGVISEVGKGSTFWFSIPLRQVD